MSYADLISEATGVTDPKELEELEDIMRESIYHSTLDWQTREELMAGARLAKSVVPRA